MPQYRQDLSKAAGGKLTGRGGGTQTLGAAAQKRMAAKAPPAPAQPAWKQLAAQGIGGQGSAAANKAKLAGMTPPPPAPATEILRAGPLGGGMTKPNFPPDVPLGGLPPGAFGRGMASFLRPPMQNDMDLMMQDQGALGAQALPGQMNVGPPAGPLGAAVNDAAASMPGGGQVPASMTKPNFPGVNSNAFAANGGTPSGAPLQPGGGQAARIAALIARLRGGGAGLQPQMA